jgi:hypothetical protein
MREEQFPTHSPLPQQAVKVAESNVTPAESVSEAKPPVLEPEVMNPVPQGKEEKLMTFGEAVMYTAKDKKIARREWEDKTVYGYMKLGVLSIFIDGKVRQWIISDGDLQGEDWYIV